MAIDTQEFSFTAIEKYNLSFIEFGRPIKLGKSPKVRFMSVFTLKLNRDVGFDALNTFFH